MKKFFFTFIAAAFTIGAYAQKESKKQINVPQSVKQSFGKQFPGSTAKWEKEGDKYEAGFKQNGHEMSVLFDANGTISETEIEIEANELPALVLPYIKQHYKGATIKEAAKITKANGEINYEAEVKGKDVIFDAAGKFIKEAKD